MNKNAYTHKEDSGIFWLYTGCNWYWWSQVKGWTNDYEHPIHPDYNKLSRRSDLDKVSTIAKECLELIEYAEFTKRKDRLKERKDELRKYIKPV